MAIANLNPPVAVPAVAEREPEIFEIIEPASVEKILCPSMAIDAALNLISQSLLDKVGPLGVDELGELAFHFGFVCNDHCGASKAEGDG